MTQTFKVKGWEKHQHYKDRNPPWIRFYNTTLDDYEVAHLPDVAKAHLFGIWLLASRYENEIPYDAEWISKKINATEPVDLERFASLGLIIISGARTKTLARRKQVDVPEERQSRAEQSRPPKVPKEVVYPEGFESFWKAYPSRGTAANPKHPAFLKWERALESGVEPDDLTAAALRYRLDIGEKNGTEFVVQATRWFNEKRYLDKPAPVVANVTPLVNPDDSLWEARMAGWNRSKFWNRDQWGPPPGEAACKVPKRFIAEPKSFDPIADMPEHSRRGVAG